MAFIRVAERRTQRALGRLTLSLVAARNREHQVYSLRLVIGKAVAQERRWTDRTRIGVLWGSGDDFGWIKLEERVEGGRKLTAQRHLLVTEFRTIPVGNLAGPDGSAWRLMEKPQRAVDCRYAELPDGSIKVEIPQEWFKCVRVGRPKFKVA